MNGTVIETTHRSGGSHEATPPRLGRNCLPTNPPTPGEGNKTNPSLMAGFVMAPPPPWELGGHPESYGRNRFLFGGKKTGCPGAPDPPILPKRRGWVRSTRPPEARPASGTHGRLLGRWTAAVGQNPDYTNGHELYTNG